MSAGGVFALRVKRSWRSAIGGVLPACLAPLYFTLSIKNKSGETE